MLNRVHKGGRTFGGLARYLTRGNRHDATETMNLSSSDARTSARIMQATADDAKMLKRLAGRSARGRPLAKPCHHFTNSWHPSESPSDEEMFGYGRRCVATLGFEDRQVVMVIHRDKKYKGKVRDELHVMTNRVSPENGMAAPDDDDAIKLKDVAKLYEQEQGRIHVPSRFQRRPSAQRERKRMRIGGIAVPMTQTERTAFSAMKTRHRAERTPAPQRRTERARLGRGIRYVRRLRTRVDHLEEMAAPRRPVPLPVVLPTKPARPRADLIGVRVEVPQPVAAPAPVSLTPEPTRPRVDLAQIRIEVPRPVEVPSPVVLAPEPTRPRVGLEAAERIAAEVAEREQREREREAAAAERLAALHREQAAAATAAADARQQFMTETREAVDEIGATIGAAHPRMDWDSVVHELDGLYTDPKNTERYGEKIAVGPGPPLYVGAARSDLEQRTVEAARTSSTPARSPNAAISAVRKVATAIAAAVDELLEHVLDRILPDRVHAVPDPVTTCTPSPAPQDDVIIQPAARETAPAPTPQPATTAPQPAKPVTTAPSPYDNRPHETRAADENVAGLSDEEVKELLQQTQDQTEDQTQNRSDNPSR